MATNARSSRNVIIPDPPFVVDLFNNTRWSWLWLILRLYLGYEWITSGLEKLANPAWVQTGTALQGFWTNAVKIPVPPARPLIAFGWYRSFIQWMLDMQAYTWFAKLVTAGEIIVGVCLILGAFVGIAAFLGAFLNWNFMMAGSASINPVMFVLTILLIMAWKTAGWYGLDRWLLPSLGTPWHAAPRLRQSAVPVTGPEENLRLADREPYERGMRERNPRLDEDARDIDNDTDINRKV